MSEIVTASDLARLPEDLRQAFFAQLTHEEARALEHDWRFWARPAQLPPGSLGALPPTRWDNTPGPAKWFAWAIIAGRGFGKTRTGAEFAIEKARAMPGSHGALVGATVDDVRKTMLSSGLEHMEEASGILKVSPPDFRPYYEPSKRILTWPNGTVASLYSAEEPDRLRGPQHHWGWIDEVAAWAKELEAWNQLLFGMRLGEEPQVCLTTTPRAVKILKEILSALSTVVSRGGTMENAANLSRAFFDNVVSKLIGTRVGRQELEGEMLDDVPGALWQWAMWDRPGARVMGEPPEMGRIVVAVDPSGGSGKENDEQGIMVCGLEPGTEGKGALLEDCSCKLSPGGWGRRAVEAYRDWEADRIVYEVNFGGEMVKSVIETAARDLGIGPVPTSPIVASRSKQARAEPVAALYEQGKIVHYGVFPATEGELCTWVPNTGARSPNRLDALVFAFTDLMLGGAAPTHKRRSGLGRRA